MYFSLEHLQDLCIITLCTIFRGNSKMNRIEAIAFDLKQSIDDLIHELKLIREELDKIKERQNIE